MLKVSIYGASGYTGQELLRLLIRHSQVDITSITSRKYKGVHLSDVFPVFKNLTAIKFMDASPGKIIPLCDVVFLALPHGEAMEIVPEFLSAGKKVVDLGADFRFNEVETYEKWYGKHASPSLMKRAVYGLPELHRDELKGADFVANPGCYPTSAILGLAPLIANQCVDNESIIVDSKSGASGAGREPQLGSLFCEINEGFKAYKVGVHRHTPEIEQELSLLAKKNIRISFTPHLIPVNRGILSTIYVNNRMNLSTPEIVRVYEEFYGDEPFIRIQKPGIMPDISSVRGSNYCDIGITVDDRTGRIIIVSVIDNLVKGAAGQAVQNMNLMCGLPEANGLGIVSLFP
ncbi:MAG: N-acetyl-gamma-glutamyl-phosphate reductase [Deltaproteobacteria bacterium]|nr:N-acetyl-gamma-glutamyl-phosphate reductase [Deltaproteobacteria bacterium]